MLHLNNHQRKQIQRLFLNLVQEHPRNNGPVISPTSFTVQFNPGNRSNSVNYPVQRGDNSNGVSTTAVEESIESQVPLLPRSKS